MTTYANEVDETLTQLGRRYVAPVTVKIGNTSTLATLYVDKSRSAVLENPLPINVDDIQAGVTRRGNYSYWVDPGEYDEYIYDAFMRTVTVPLHPDEPGGSGGGPHPDLAVHDALGLATQAELDAEAAIRLAADNTLNADLGKKLSAFSADYLSPVTYPAGSSGEMMWLRHFKDGPIDGLPFAGGSGGVRIADWGTPNGQILDGMLQFDSAFPRYVHKNQTTVVDFVYENIDGISGVVSYTEGNGQGGSSQRAVLIVAPGRSDPQGDPSLAVDSIQLVLTPQSFGVFYYSAARVMAGQPGQVWFAEDGTEIPEETTFASRGFSNLIENDWDDPDPIVYRFSMTVNRFASTVTIDIPKIGARTYYHPQIKQIWSDRGSLLAYQIVRHDNCGDPRFHGLGKSSHSMAVHPLEESPIVPTVLSLVGGTDISGGLTTPTPPYWRPHAYSSIFTGLAGVAMFDPDAWATGTRQAIGPNQWSSDSNTFWWGLSHDTASFKFAFSVDGINEHEITSPTITPPATGTFLGVVWLFRPGTAPYTGANNSATSPASVEWWTFPDGSDGIGPLTSIGRVYYASGIGGIPFQRPSADGANSTPPPLTIGRRSTRTAEPFGGRIKVAQLFETSGASTRVVDPILGMPLVAGRDLRQTWETTVAIASTAPAVDSPDGTHNTLVTLATPLKSALWPRKTVTIRGVTTATLANGHWGAIPLTPTTFTIPVNTASQGVGTGGTVVIAYPQGAGQDWAGNRWGRNGTARYLIDGTAIWNGS